MGHFFSRAIKRLTLCSNRNQLPSHEQQERPPGAASLRACGAQTTAESRPSVQSIPVGQSIDSAEYAAMNERQQLGPSGAGESPGALRLSADDDDETTLVANGDEPKVEEAVIKIQALVRGHLTRKALKDAQQQAATLPANALGQSQFDEESLTKNPPSAIFLASSPLSSASGAHAQQAPTQARAPALESIAEETAQAAPAAPAAHAAQVERPGAGNSARRQLSAKERTLARSPAETADSGSMSPGPSEANASIDLTCDTPTSVSIDILDHNIRAADALASVLHPKALEPAETTPQGPPRSVTGPAAGGSLRPAHEEVRRGGAADNESPPCASLPSGRRECRSATGPPSHMNLLTNSHSIDSAEAAAIRIQSAYRGYHTRKHSPYRRRSPADDALHLSSPPAMSLDNGYLLPADGGSSPWRAPGEEEPLRNCAPIGRNRANIVRRQGAEDDDEPAECASEHLRDAAASAQARLQQAAALASLTDHQQERRPSRQRQRLDEQPSSIASTSEDENSTQTTRISLPQAPENELMDGAHGHSSRPPAARSSGDAAAHEALDSSISLEQLDTESSNLGAALSLNEDAFEAVQANPNAGAGACAEAERKSLGSSTCEVDRNESETSDDREKRAHDDSAHCLVAQLTNEDEGADEDESENGRRAALGDSAVPAPAPAPAAAAAAAAAPDLLQVAEEATLIAGETAAETLANAILDEDEQGNTEMTSDDVERRDPSGLASEQQANWRPALISAGSSLEAENDLENPDRANRQQQQALRLAVESPDEAIGSGRSSPALISSEASASPTSSIDENDSDQGDVDDDADADDEENKAQKRATHQAKQQHQQQQHPQQHQQQQQQQQTGAHSQASPRKRTRNRRKGRK